MSHDVYFAAKSAEETAEILISRSNDWFQTMDSSGYLDKLRTSWLAYHGSFYESNGEAHSISFGGEQGELTQMAVNHYRNIAQHILNMITSTRPTMQARAINTDQKSLEQASLANGLLDYYMRDHRLEEYLKLAVEYSIVFGSGYVKLEWNALAGEVFDFDEETGADVRPGDIEFSNLSPFDVMFDTNSETSRHDWVICRSFKNRFDIAAKYPELREQILALPTKSQILKFSTFQFSFDETDLIPIYEFYHNRTEAVPDGRYLLYLDGDVVLLDSPMPYRDLPVYRISPATYLGTPYGYTPMFDLLPLQDALNAEHSAILSNHTAFGVQSVVVPKGSDIDVTQLSSGMNFIEADERNGTIRALQLTQTPKEVFDYIEKLVQDMETISGVNAVTRGNPDPNLRSGNAMALVQAMSLQFLSGLQQSYVMLIEDMGTGIINVLKDHANVPRVATIVGKTKRSYIKEFRGDDLDAVNRVVVDIGNPLARTTAGRVEMAEQMMQMGVIKTPEQYFQVIDTGSLEVMTEDYTSQLNLIQGENERLASLSGQVIAVLTDDHVLHIKEHASVLNDPDLRLDPNLVSKVTAHIQEHITILQTADPNLLNILGQQSLMPQGGPPQQPSQQGPAPSNMAGNPTPTAMDQTGAAPGPLPSPAQVSPDMLVNPALQEASLGNVRQ